MKATEKPRLGIRILPAQEKRKAIQKQLDTKAALKLLKKLGW